MRLRPFRSEMLGREQRGYEFWCPGCARTHHLVTWSTAVADSRGRPSVPHRFNGDPEHPSFSGELSTMRPQGEWVDDGLGGQLWIPTSRQVPYCTVQVVLGTLRYARHCGHYLAGMTVSMVRIPTTREARHDLVSRSRELNEHHQRSGHKAMVVAGIGFRRTQ